MIINEKEFAKRLEHGDFGVIFPKNRSESDAKKIADMTDYAVGVVKYDDNSFGIIIDKRKVATDSRKELNKEDSTNESGM